MPKTTTLKFSPSEYKTKAEEVLNLLRRGLSVKEIRNRMAVSESYIYLAKKQLKEAADKLIIEAAEAVKEACTFTPKKEGVDTILDDRGTNYGTFLSLSQVTQRLKAVAHQFAGQHNKTFDADQAEALDMIFTKVGRILNGDSNHIDSWIDIAGYATLVADRLQGKAR